MITATRQVRESLRKLPILTRYFTGCCFRIDPCIIAVGVRLDYITCREDLLNLDEGYTKCFQ